MINADGVKSSLWCWDGGKQARPTPSNPLVLLANFAAGDISANLTVHLRPPEAFLYLLEGRALANVPSLRRVVNGVQNLLSQARRDSSEPAFCIRILEPHAAVKCPISKDEVGTGC